MEVEIKYLEKIKRKVFNGDSNSTELVALAWNYLPTNSRTDYRLAYYWQNHNTNHFYLGNLKLWKPVDLEYVNSMSDFHEDTKEKFLSMGVTIKII